MEENLSMQLESIADGAYDLRQLFIGNKLHECTTWEPSREKLPINSKEGLFEARIEWHATTFPVHPYCIRRTYWNLQLELEKNKKAPKVKFSLFEVSPYGANLRAQGTFDKKDVASLSIEKLQFTSYVGKDNLPVDFTRGGIITPADASKYETGKVVNKLLIQEWVQIIRTSDWDFIDKNYYNAVVYDEGDGLTYLESVQLLKVAYDRVIQNKPTIMNYHPFPRYPQY